MTHKFKTTNIHGKQYVEVNERIKYFRTAPDYAGWSLETEWLDFTGNRAMCRAVIRDKDNRLIATGTAFEMLGSSNINKTSHIENCETSAWGRALGNLGIGVDTSIATAEEVQTAILQQQEKPAKKSRKKKPVPAEEPEVPADDLPEYSKDYGTRGWRNGVAAIFALAGENGLTEDNVHAFVLEEFGKASMKEMSTAQLRKVYSMIKNGEVSGAGK